MKELLLGTEAKHFLEKLKDLHLEKRKSFMERKCKENFVTTGIFFDDCGSYSVFYCERNGNLCCNKFIFYKDALNWLMEC